MQTVSEVNWEEIRARHQKMEEIAYTILVPRIQVLDATTAMLAHLYNIEDEAMGYTPTSLIKIMANHVHELARDCLKITDEMVGIDSDTSPLGDEAAESD